METFFNLLKTVAKYAGIVIVVMETLQALAEKLEKYQEKNDAQSVNAD